MACDTQALLDLSERVYEALDDYLVRYNTVERLPIINLTPGASLQVYISQCLVCVYIDA